VKIVTMNLRLHILKTDSMHNSFFCDACPFSHVPEHSTFITMEACLRWSMKLITVVYCQGSVCAVVYLYYPAHFPV